MTKAECAKQIIAELQRYRKAGNVCWADDIDIDSADKAVMVCQNVVQSWAETRGGK